MIAGAYRNYLALLSTLVLIACSGQPNTPWGRSSDGAPLRSITADQVENAVPRPDPILAAGNKSPYTVLGKSYSILNDASGYREQGIASWYGTKFNGQKTSNGEIFDLYQATAAHKSLPIPSYAKVTNLNNGKSVVVRVNDRGPFHSERLIDLSYGAAVKLGYMAQGTAPVEVELLDIPGVDDRRNTTLGSYRYLQTGAYADSVAAQNSRDKLAGIVDAPVSVSPVQSGEVLLYRVRVGPVSKPGELRALKKQLKNEGYSSVQALP